MIDRELIDAIKAKFPTREYEAGNIQYGLQPWFIEPVARQTEGHALPRRPYDYDWQREWKGELKK